MRYNYYNLLIQGCHGQDEDIENKWNHYKQDNTMTDECKSLCQFVQLDIYLDKRDEFDLPICLNQTKT